MYVELRTVSISLDTRYTRNFSSFL